MRISDWSSDVCSSDLRIGRTGRGGASGRAFTLVTPEDAEAIGSVEKLIGGKIPVFELIGEAVEAPEEKPRAKREDRAERADRKSVVLGKGCSVRVDIGGLSIISKKNNINHIIK